jgi:DNA-binding NarL/FixJ family response regulator
VSKIRVVLADDHPPMVAMVRAMLRQEFEVIGTAENGNQAVDSVLNLDADVPITDISMPVANGLQAAERLHMANCRARIVFLTLHKKPAYVRAAFVAGASAYVIKSRLLTDLIPAIREAVLGNIFVSQPQKFASLDGSSNKTLVS